MRVTMTTPSSSGSTDSDLAYQVEILQGVSRTFALTIPQLPGTLRHAVGNAYLLCRITDTVEDEPALSAGQKQAFSKRFVEVVAVRAEAESFAHDLGALLAPATTASERDLSPTPPGSFASPTGCGPPSSAHSNAACESCRRAWRSFSSARHRMD